MSFNFGTRNQVNFDEDANMFFSFIGYISNPEHEAKVVWERNDESGAWGQEGRVEFRYNVPNEFLDYINITAGRSGISGRLNCNKFVEYITENYGFVLNADVQDYENIRALIPEDFVASFDEGYNL